MANGTRKLVCLSCKADAYCFYRGRTVEGVFLKDEYVLQCSKCNWHKISKLHAGFHTSKRDSPIPTRCPFCGKPAEDHAKPDEGAKSLPLGEIVRRMNQLHYGEDGELHTPPKPIPAAEEEPELIDSESVVSAEDGAVPEEPHPAAELPPRTRRLNVEKKPTTSRDIRNLLIWMALLYALVLGILSFIAQIWDGAAIGAAFRMGLSVAGLTLGLAVCIFPFVFLFRPKES